MRITTHLLIILLVLIATVPEAMGQRRRGGAAPRDAASWASDGKHVIVKGTWYDPLTWKEVAPVAEDRDESVDVPAAFRDAVEKAGGDAPRAAFAPSRFRSTIPRTNPPHAGVAVTPDQAHAATIVSGELWAWHKDKGARRVRRGIDEVRRLEISPDGASVSFVSGFDLHVVKTRDGEALAIADDGSEDLFYGELDWVYQEEVYGRGNFKATWWSPDSRHLAYMRIDEQGVDTFSVVDHIPDALGVENIKYPKAGTTNPRATLHIARASDGESVAVDLSDYAAKSQILIVRVGWTPEGDHCIFEVQDREQTWLDLNAADPETGKVTKLIHEECEDGWVNRLSPPRWLEDGTFIWESERTGYKHLYRYDRTGKLVSTISYGPWTMGSVRRVDEERGFVTFTGTTADYCIGQNLYMASLDGKKLRQLTKGDGTHSASVNHDASLVLDRRSSMTDPGDQVLRRVGDGETIRVIYDRKPPSNAQLPVYQQIKARDGEWLDVMYVPPADMDPSKKYPVWLNTYSGPNAPSIRDGWRGPARQTWYAQLAVNVRSASGRGMKYTKTCYRQFGVQELKDIEDAVDWMCREHSWADRSRVGITGWSYGGFMTAYAMTHSEYFKCGIAGAGVYAWELYDTIYTERYMATPQNNEDGYRVSSCVKAAGDLHGELLIVHGTMDDNVHMQNALQLIHALQEADKQNFEFMLYPKARHGVRSPHLAELRERFMKEHL